jgi:hypothetical protein
MYAFYYLDSIRYLMIDSNGMIINHTPNSNNKRIELNANHLYIK